MLIVMKKCITISISLIDMEQHKSVDFKKACHIPSHKWQKVPTLNTLFRHGTHFALFRNTFLKSSLFTLHFTCLTLFFFFHSPLFSLCLSWLVGITTGCNSYCVVCIYRWLFGLTFAICPSSCRNNAEVSTRVFSPSYSAVRWAGNRRIVRSFFKNSYFFFRKFTFAEIVSQCYWLFSIKIFTRFYKISKFNKIVN